MALEATSPAAASSDAASSVSSSASSSTSVSSPQSTSDIAASVISEMESGTSGTSDEPTRTSGDEAPPVAAAKPAPAVDPDDFDTVQNENAIPHKRVKAMITKKEAAAEKRVIASIAKELGISKAEAELKLEDITGELTTRKTKFSEYEGVATMAQQVEAIMEKEPERFVNMMLTANPAYREVMQKVLGVPAAKSGTETVDGDDPEPEMDYDLGNGQKTYSAEGFKKLRAWERRQGKKDAEALINEKLSPYEQERKAKQERERVEAIHTQAREAIGVKLEKARKWPEFTKHEDAIAKVINESGASLEDAYMQVVMPKLAADRNTMRESLIAEQAAATRNTSVGAGPAPPKADKAKTTADYAREELAKAERA